LATAPSPERLAEVSKEIREFIVEELLFGRGGDELSDEASLTDRGVVDSTGVLELVGFLEETFGIEVGDDELVPENLDSIKLIAAFVAEKTAK
jgi:acyl carrier protein